MASILAFAVLACGTGVTGAAAVTPLKSCGVLTRYDAAVGARRTNCYRARQVARRYMFVVTHRDKWPRSVLAFSCRKVRIQAAAGWYGRCQRRRAVVKVLPQ